MDLNQFKIFISYRRNDSPVHAGRLRDAIRHKYDKNEKRVFDDVTNIRPGAYFPSVIKESIEDASVMVVAIGPRWAGRRLLRKARVFSEGDWIHKEIETAINAGTRILPVLINDGEMPVKRDLPETLHFFADLHAVTVRDSNWGQDIENVYTGIEHLAKLPPLTVPQKDVERKIKKKSIPGWALIVVAVIAISLTGYFIFNPWPKNEQPDKTQQTTGAWRSKIAMVVSKGPRGEQGTGFFVSNNGHILTLGIDNSEKDQVFNVLTSDKKNYEAHEVLRINLTGLPLVLLKSPLKNTPYIQLASRIPVKNLPIEILGVERLKESEWKRYTARVLNGDSEKVFYERPEEGWMGLMGAPIVDVSDEMAFGIHIGTVFDSTRNKINPKSAHGLCLTKNQVDSLLSAMKK